MVPAHDAGTGLEGRSLGEAQRGGSFILDPFDAYGVGPVVQSERHRGGALIGAGKEHGW